MRIVVLLAVVRFLFEFVGVVFLLCVRVVSWVWVCYVCLLLLASLDLLICCLLGLWLASCVLVLLF